MQSNVPCEILDLPEPTAQDVAALARMRTLNSMDPHEYLAFLLEFSAQHPPTREVTILPEPFEL